MPISNQIPPSRLIQPGVVDSAATRPASPFEGQMVYQKDTDELLAYNGSSWTKPWNIPWGVVAYAKKTSTTSLTGTVAEVLAAPSFTAVTGRVYKVTVNAYFQGISSSSYYRLLIFNGSTQIQGADWSASTTSQYLGPTMSTYTSGISGATVMSLRAAVGAGTGQLYADTTGYPAVIIVEDIGPA